jgi:hypothetical protein
VRQRLKKTRAVLRLMREQAGFALKAAKAAIKRAMKARSPLRRVKRVGQGVLEIVKKMKPHFQNLVTTARRIKRESKGNAIHRAAYAIGTLPREVVHLKRVVRIVKMAARRARPMIRRAVSAGKETAIIAKEAFGHSKQAVHHLRHMLCLFRESRESLRRLLGKKPSSRSRRRSSCARRFPHPAPVPQRHAAFLEKKKKTQEAQRRAAHKLHRACTAQINRHPAYQRFPNHPLANHFRRQCDIARDGLLADASW